MTLDSRQIEKLTDFFRNRPVLRAYLFGSCARGQANSQSDIDILVDLDYSQRIGLAFVQMQIDLQKIFDAKVDLVSSNGLSQEVKQQIDQDKALIYAR
ncbi:MAG: nucleotidyltransferase [Flavobacteriia bacterium]|nr:nucleotidyltransferase [Flavobacteriia bacterium]